MNNPFFYVYPNPATNYFQLAMNNDYVGQLNIKLYNILGRKILNTSRLKQNQQINEIFSPNNLQAGLYYLEISVKQKRYIHKILIMK